MIVTNKLKMDLIRWEKPEPIDVMQRDIYGRSLQFRLLANGAPYYPPADCTVLIRYTRPDRTGGIYDTLPDGSPAWSLEGNVLTVCLAPQVCAEHGTVELVITLLRGCCQVHCFTLELKVHSNQEAGSDDGDYVNICGFIPQPDRAEAGQYLEVETVDAMGRITALKTVAAPEGSGSLPENVVTCDLEGSAETEDTVPLNADTLGGLLPDAFMRARTAAVMLEASRGITVQIQRVGPLVVLSWDGRNTEAFAADTWQMIAQNAIPLNKGAHSWMVFCTDGDTSYRYTVSIASGCFQINARDSEIPADKGFRGMLTYISDDINTEVTE